MPLYVSYSLLLNGVCNFYSAVQHCVIVLKASETEI